MKKAIPIIVVTWIASLLTTLTIVYFSPNISAPLKTNGIPFAETYAFERDVTDSTLDWVDIRDTSTSVTLQRTSNILILFSANAWTDTKETIISIRALVNDVVAQGGAVNLTPAVISVNGQGHYLETGAYSFTFYQPSLGAGTYVVKMQWVVARASQSTSIILPYNPRAYIAARTLTVTALPK